MEQSTQKLRRTPLFEQHRNLGAKFVEFGGWEMPVLYKGVIEEHKTVRSALGAFDVSHMGEIFVSGPRAAAFLQWVTPNDISRLKNGRAQYSQLLNEIGGVIDDIIVYQISPDNFLVCVNAANAETDHEWLVEQNRHSQFGGAQIVNASDAYGQVAIQGVNAEKLGLKLWGDDPSMKSGISRKDFPAFHFRVLSGKQPFGSSVESHPTIVARTGYTGEDGFEVFCPVSSVRELWDAVLAEGAPLGIQPIGLGARDTLRLEAALPLHGHELRPDISPLESGFGWVVKLGKGDFIGKAALLKEQQEPPRRKLVGFEVIDRGIARDGAKVLARDGSEIGWVTSGTKTPSLERAIGLAFVPPSESQQGNELLVEVRDKQLKIQIVKTPFYRPPYLT